MKNIQSLITKRFAKPAELPKQRVDFEFQAVGIEMQTFFCREPAATDSEKEQKRLKSEKSRLWQLFYRYELWMIRWAFKECQTRSKPFLGYLVFLLQMEQWRRDGDWYREQYALGNYEEMKAVFYPRKYLYSKKDTDPMMEALAKVGKG